MNILLCGSFSQYLFYLLIYILNIILQKLFHIKSAEALYKLAYEFQNVTARTYLNHFLDISRFLTQLFHLQL